MSNQLLDETEERREMLAKLAMDNMRSFGEPASQWEADTLAEVLTLPQVTVARPPRAQLFDLGFEPYNCHANCARQEENDEDRLSRHISGWLVGGHSLILHSVVQIGDDWFCLTPQLQPAPSNFQYIPDPSIQWQEASDGNGWEPFRHGHPVPDALRKYPELFIRMSERFHVLMASGVPSEEAVAIVDATVGAELRLRAPI